MTAELIKGLAIGTPRVESSDYIMAVGSARPMEDAARIAFYELVIWLEADYGIERLMAYQALLTGGPGAPGQHGGHPLLNRGQVPEALSARRGVTTGPWERST